MSKENIVYGILCVVFGLFLIWALIALGVWAMGSPMDNGSRCKAIADSKGASFSTTGWRADTCYLYKDGKEEIIKL